MLKVCIVWVREELLLKLQTLYTWKNLRFYFPSFVLFWFFFFALLLLSLHLKSRTVVAIAVVILFFLFLLSLLIVKTHIHFFMIIGWACVKFGARVTLYVRRRWLLKINWKRLRFIALLSLSLLRALFFFFFSLSLTCFLHTFQRDKHFHRVLARSF